MGQQIVGAAIAIISGGLGLFGNYFLEGFRNKNERIKQATQQRIEAYRSLLHAVTVFDLHEDIPEGDPAREGLPSPVQITTDLMKANADLFLFGSDKAQHAGTLLIRACTSNSTRTPESRDHYARLRYEFISVVREELGEHVAPIGEGALPDNSLSKRIAERSPQAPPGQHPSQPQ